MSVNDPPIHHCGATGQSDRSLFFEQKSHRNRIAPSALGIGFHDESWDAVPGSELNAAPLTLKRGGQDVCATHLLMQAVSDQTACALYKLSVFFSERVQLITLHVHHSKNVPMVIPYGNNNF